MENKVMLFVNVEGLGLMVEVMDDQSFSFGLVTHKTKALEIIVNLHINKVVFNVISSLKNIIIIGLSLLVLHNP
jgi:hypothetical protein